MNIRTPVRRVAVLGVAAAVIGALLVGCSSGTAAPAPSATMPSGLATPGTDIPTTTVDLGLSPYGDELLSVAAINRGYFDEVGIKFNPAPNGQQTNLIKDVTPLINGDLDLGSGYPPVLISQMDNVNNVVGFMNQDVFYGYEILAPKGKYKTVDEEMAGGSTFDEAVTTVVKQLDGQDVILRNGVVPAFYQLITSTAGTSMDKWNITYLDNPDIVRAAQTGQADFVSPSGAVELTRLIQDGWEPLVTLSQVIDNTPSDATIALRATFSGYLTTTEYAKDNWDTLLRYASVIYRIIDDFQADPEGVAADYVDYVNSYTGSSLTAAELAGTFDGLYSLQNFEDSAELYDDPSAPFNFDTVMNAQIKSLTDQGVIAAGHDASQISIAADVYHALLEYKAAADQAIASAPEGETKTKAEQLYEDRDYLDAYRLATAAGQ